MGFSAGGHLASTVATHATGDALPNFQILFYPVISMEQGVTHQGSRENLLGKKPKRKLVSEYCNEHWLMTTASYYPSTVSTTMRSCMPTRYQPACISTPRVVTASAFASHLNTIWR